MKALARLKPHGHAQQQSWVRASLLLFCILLLNESTTKVQALSSLLDAANMALKNSPSSTRFVTNRMCPFAQKVWCALEASGIPYEMQEISLYGANGKPDWFRKLNPAGTVPVLVAYGGAAVYPDSDIILDQFQQDPPTLSGSKATPLYPPADRPEVRQAVQEWRARINRMLPIGKDSVLRGSGRSMSSELHACLEEMEQAVVGPYLASQRLTTADCHAFPFLWRLQQEYPQAFDNCDFPKLSKWLQHSTSGESSSSPLARTVQTSWWWWW